MTPNQNIRAVKAKPTMFCNSIVISIIRQIVTNVIFTVLFVESDVPPAV